MIFAVFLTFITSVSVKKEQKDNNDDIISALKISFNNFHGNNDLVNRLCKELFNKKVKPQKEPSSIPLNYDKMDNEDLRKLAIYYQARANKAMNRALFSRKSRYNAIKEFQTIEDFGLAASLILGGFFGDDKNLDPLAYFMLQRAAR